MFRFLSSLLILISVHAQAGDGTSSDPAAMPARDKILADFIALFGKSADVFFEERDRDEALGKCRLALKEVRSAYLAARKNKNYGLMSTLLVGNSDSEVEADKGLARLLNECGRCAAKVRPVDRNKLSPTYESDGWCRLPGKDAATRIGALEKATKRLANPKTYSNRNEGGLNYVLHFEAIDEKGAPTENSASPFLAKIAVPGLFGIGFGYNVINHYGSRKSGENDEFLLQFARVAKPEFKTMNLTDRLGRNVVVLPLPEAYGQWFVDDQGNFRYYNRAKFQLPPFAQQLVQLEALAMQIHMDTLFTIYDDLMEGVGE